MRSSGEMPAAVATRVLMSFSRASRFPRPSLDETDIENDQVVGVMHADERRRVQKAVLRQLEDELEEVVCWHTERVHQGRLDGTGYSGDPGLVVATLDDVDLGERHGVASFHLGPFNAALRWPAQCPARHRCKA